jgi:hypothetical protein
VHLVARQPAAGAEARECGKYLVLEATTAFEIRFCRPDIGQEPADHGADRQVLLGCPDSSAAVNVRWK